MVTEARSEDLNSRNDGLSDAEIFPNFINRLVIIGLDILIVVVVAGSTNDLLGQLLTVDPSHKQIVSVVIAAIYFVGSWASPMCATPMQWLFKVSVVNRDLRALSPLRALVRTILLVLLIHAFLSIARAPYIPWLGIVCLVACGAVLLATITVNRQGLHDLIVNSYVVYRRVLIDEAQRRQLIDRFSTSTVIAIDHRQWPGLLRDMCVLGIPLVALHIGSSSMYEHHTRAGVVYALSETNELKQAIETFYASHGRAPANAVELGVGGRVHYPDGGYYELQANGKIGVYFTVKPELRNGGLILSPTAMEDHLSWSCEATGEIKQAMLPSSCRN